MKKIILKSLPLLTISLISFLAVVLIGTAQAQAQLNFEAQVPIPGMEGVVPVGTKAGGQIQSTLLGEYVKNIYNYSFAVAGILAAIVLMGGGVMWLVSGGNQSSISKAKEIIGGSLIGLGILFSAYILLRTINPALLEMRPISIDNIGAIPTESSSNTLNCCQCELSDVYEDWALKTESNKKSLTTCEASQGLTLEMCEEICKQQGLKNNTENYKPGFAVDSKCGATAFDDKGSYQLCTKLKEGEEYIAYRGDFQSEGWNFQSGIEKQIPHMSSDLAWFLNCLRANLPTEVNMINSISDSNIVSGDISMDDCNKPNCERSSDKCQHSCESCHYGGGENEGSYAVDLNDTKYFSAINQAAQKCDAGSYVVNEDSHIHVSTSACKKN